MNLVSLMVLATAALAQPTPAKPVPMPDAVIPKEKVEDKVMLDDGNLTLEGSLNLRDPFRRPQNRLAGKDSGNIPELERFAVDQFKLVGVITGQKKNKALITTPEGKMHIVTENTPIGTRHGMVRKIAPGSVVVEEKVVNVLGQEEKLEAIIEFKDKDKDKL